jgi:hypothetical protein
VRYGSEGLIGGDAGVAESGVVGVESCGPRSKGAGSGIHSIPHANTTFALVSEDCGPSSLSDLDLKFFATH